MEKYVIVGLGNPGFRYRRTRHNMGFMVVEYLSEKHHIKIKKLKGKALIGEGTIGNNSVILAKPQTYMNLSGQSINELLNYFDISINQLIVIYDDMDIPLGKIRIRKKGGSGTHNGMKSIIYQLQSEEFIRIRIGIGEKVHKDAKGHVLSRFSKEEKTMAFTAIQDGADAVIDIMEQGINYAMNRYHQ